MPVLELAKLKLGLPGVHSSRSLNHIYACLVCLEKQGHVSGVDLKVEGFVTETYQLVWDDTLDEQLRRTWSDIQEATEWGATAIAFLLILEQTSLTAIDRSRKGTGFDYWLGLREDVANLVFRNEARLEVSGIMEAKSLASIRRRVREKVKQASRSDKTDLPAYIVVVEFKIPYVYMAKT